MNDMKQTIVPKSDQLNADDLISGPMTITITGVSIKGGQEQPVAISFEGDNGKPYKACKSMCRVMVMAWGPDASKYVGRSMTLYRDPTVTWAGMQVGGIRISHMTDIDEKMTMALTATRQSKKPFTVRPLVATEKKAAPPLTPDAERPPSPDQVGGAAPTNAAARNIAPADASIGAEDAASAATYITPEKALALEARCNDNAIPVAKLKAAAKVDRLSMLDNEGLARAHGWIDRLLAKRQEQTT